MSKMEIKNNGEHVIEETFSTGTRLDRWDNGDIYSIHATST